MNLRIKRSKILFKTTHASSSLTDLILLQGLTYYVRTHACARRFKGKTNQYAALVEENVLKPMQLMRDKFFSFINARILSSFY